MHRGIPGAGYGMVWYGMECIMGMLIAGHFHVFVLFFFGGG